MAARGRGCRRRRSTGRDPGKGSGSASAPGSGSDTGPIALPLPLPLPLPVPAAMAAVLGPSALARLRWGSAFCSIAAGGLGAFAAAFAKLALKPTSRGPEEEEEQELPYPPAMQAWVRAGAGPAGGVGGRAALLEVLLASRGAAAPAVQGAALEGRGQEPRRSRRLMAHRVWGGGALCSAPRSATAGWGGGWDGPLCSAPWERDCGVGRGPGRAPLQRPLGAGLRGGEGLSQTLLSPGRGIVEKVSLPSAAPPRSSTAG
ncbi:uncharacterized protein LOC122728693 [Dromiciops gliroides]|uniref:uncharacterized protein LOC122728693 n=1 Tax=Dromiciops gliroides TaxID=33562 RepID=UPI001CC543AE|nr:uncharacterized protein LOC122728693 [Dromiciops gliroides]